MCRNSSRDKVILGLFVEKRNAAYFLEAVNLQNNFGFFYQRTSKIGNVSGREGKENEGKGTDGKGKEGKVK